MRSLMALALAGFIASPAHAGWLDSIIDDVLDDIDICELVQPAPIGCRADFVPDCWGIDDDVIVPALPRVLLDPLPPAANELRAVADTVLAA